MYGTHTGRAGLGCRLLLRHQQKVETVKVFIRATWAQLEYLGIPLSQVDILVKRKGSFRAEKIKSGFRIIDNELYREWVIPQYYVGIDVEQVG